MNNLVTIIALYQIICEARQDIMHNNSVTFDKANGQSVAIN
jgi:hypothetical protein